LVAEEYGGSNEQKEAKELIEMSRCAHRWWMLSGQSTVEYALVGALVVIAAAGALGVLGGELTTVFTNISNTLKVAAAGH
jgi:Flp pilus assembly pilin Flp